MLRGDGEEALPPRHKRGSKSTKSRQLMDRILIAPDYSTERCVALPYFFLCFLIPFVLLKIMFRVTYRSHLTRGGKFFSNFAMLLFNLSRFFSGFLLGSKVLVALPRQISFFAAVS
jgi:hypothetical protein